MAAPAVRPRQPGHAPEAVVTQASSVAGLKGR